MPISHGSNRWTVIGANVERLPNERFTVTLNCRTHNLDSDWYYANEDKIFKDFGDAYSLPLENGAGDAAAWSPQTGEAYPNLVLIETQYQGASGDDPSLIFVYETLTSTWTLEDEALSTVGENGLLTLSEDLVAIGGTALPYDEDDIGVITKVIDGTTIYLAGIQDEGSQRKGEVTLLWAEAGILSQSERSMSEGVQAVTTEFLAVEGTTLGPIYSKNVSNYEGLKTITVVNLQDNAGQSIIGTGENRVDQYERKSEFTYPGTVQPEYDTLTGTGALGEVVPQIVNFKLDPPVQTKIDATISVIFQESSDIAETDETYDDGKTGTTLGYWNPTKWATTYISGIGWSFTGFSETQGLRGYRADPENKPNPNVGVDTPDGTPEYITFQRNGALVFQALKSENATSGYLRCISSEDSGYDGDAPLIRMNGVADDQGKVFIVNGRRIYGETPFIVEARGGPENPIGNKYVLDIDIRPAFEDIDGNKYYKKTIVTATIPDNA